MLKLLLILALSLYILSKIGGFFFRAGAATTQFRTQQRKTADGKINVDGTSKGKKSSRFKGGDYVDYEEVK